MKEWTIIRSTGMWVTLQADRIEIMPNGHLLLLRDESVLVAAFTDWLQVTPTVLPFEEKDSE